jgi:hypothetical protein
MLRAVLVSALTLASSFVWAASPVAMLFDKGKAVPFYGSASSSEQQQFLDAAKNSHLADRMASVVNGSLYLRQNLAVGFESCGRVNAFFEPQRSAIVVCTEFLEMVAKTAKADIDFMMKLPREQFAKGIDGLLWGVFFHELGHAVIAINRVPVTGREEDVADEFSAWYAMNFLDVSRTPVIAPTIWLWGRMAKERSIPTMAEDERKGFLANEHSLDEQRIYNIACLALGSGTESGARAAAFAKLPEQRAQRCQSEYARADFAMQKLFKKYFKIRPLRGGW